MGMTQTGTTSDRLQAALVAQHAEIHHLLTVIGNKVDSIDPESANWGDVGNMGYIAERLRDAAGLSDQS
jgi:hypothetical protein